jgi:hypothetical protein
MSMPQRFAGPMGRQQSNPELQANSSFDESQAKSYTRNSLELLGDLLTFWTLADEQYIAAAKSNGHGLFFSAGTDKYRL